MKKVITIALMLLCIFSLSSAEWEKTQYIDEFGDPWSDDVSYCQVVKGVMEEKGKSKEYTYRFTVYIPRSLYETAGIEIEMLDELSESAAFSGNNARARVKIGSSRIVELLYDFTTGHFMRNEYEIDSIRRKLKWYDKDSVMLLNELYKGNDLKFAIYSGSSKHTFTIEADGFHNIVDELSHRFEPPKNPDIRERTNSRTTSYYVKEIYGAYEYMLELEFHTSDVYKSFTLMLTSKDAQGVFRAIVSDYKVKDVKMISLDANAYLPLDIGIRDSGSFSLYSVLPGFDEMIQFAETYDDAFFLIEIEPYDDSFLIENESSLFFVSPCYSGEILKAFAPLS